MKPTKEEMVQLLDLPEQIAVLDRKINGLKSDKVKQERKKKARESQLWLSPENKDIKPAADREANHLLMCEADPDWLKAQNRLEEIAGTIGGYSAQRDYLRRTRAGLQAKAGDYIVERLDDLIKDKDIVQAIGSKWLA